MASRHRSQIGGKGRGVAPAQPAIRAQRAPRACRSGIAGEVGLKDVARDDVIFDPPTASRYPRWVNVERNRFRWHRPPFPWYEELQAAEDTAWFASPLTQLSRYRLPPIVPAPAHPSSARDPRSTPEAGRPVEISHASRSGDPGDDPVIEPQHDVRNGEIIVIGVRQPVRDRAPVVADIPARPP